MQQAILWTASLLQNVNGRLKGHWAGVSGERLGSQGIESRNDNDEYQEVEDQKRYENYSGRLVLPRFDEHYASSVAGFSYPQSSRLRLDTVISPRPSYGQEGLNCLSHRISLHYCHRHSFIAPPQPEIVADPSAYREFKRKRRLLDERGSFAASGITTSNPAPISSKCEWAMVIV